MAHLLDRRFVKVDIVSSVDLDLHSLHPIPAHFSSDLRMNASSNRRFLVVTG
jgi:hypothetical protein